MSRERDRLPDWFVGGAGKRRLLHAVVRGGSARTWTEKELAGAADLHEKNSVRRHIAVLLQAKLLLRRRDGYRLNGRSPLLRPLDDFLTLLEQKVPKERLPPSRGAMPKRSP